MLDGRPGRRRRARGLRSGRGRGARVPRCARGAGRRPRRRRHRHRRSCSRGPCWTGPTSSSRRPGWPPHHPLLAAARERGVPVWSEVELAWQVRVDRASGGGPAPWLAVTGTNGKTTTVGMLESILRAAGENVAAVGNVGTPVVLAATDPTLDVLVVELSSFQLHFTHSMSAQAAAVLNVARRPPRLARVARRVRGRQGPHLRARPGGVRLQPRRPRAPRTWSREADVVDGCGRGRLHARHPAGRPGRAGRGRAGRPRVRAAAAHARAPSWARSTTWRSWPGRTARCRRTSSRTRWPPPRSPSRTASTPAAVRDGLRAYGPGEHRLATRRGGRRRRLRGRLQGDQRARRRGGARRVRRRAASCGSRAVWPRVRSSTSWSRRRKDRLARRRADRRRPRAVARRTRPTRTRGPRRRGRRR